MREQRAYFPEPKTRDDSFGRCKESTPEWLARSTNTRAVALREYINRTLNHFPTEVASSMATGLHTNWRAHVFEMQVGRYLQVLGARIEYQPQGSNQSRVDFFATFPDGVVSVECVTQAYNEGPRLQRERRRCLDEQIEEVAPVGWLISIHKMPDVEPEDFGPWLDPARAWMDQLPTPVREERLEFIHGDGDGGTIELEAIGFPTLTKPAIMSGGPAYFDDSTVRLREALTESRYRQQALGATRPVVLAIDAPFDGPDPEDFDVVLFGSTIAHLDRTMREYATTFDSNGILVTDQTVPFDGVLAFFRLGYTGGGDPILYLNPYSPYRLPEAIRRHETRRWRAGIETEPAKRESLISQIGFLTMPEGDD